MRNYYMDFPFDEIRQPSGDFFDDLEHVLEAGFDRSQVWAIAEVSPAPESDADTLVVYCAPEDTAIMPHVYGWLATKEPRTDLNTNARYIEEITLDS